jgi:hypothetical protein
MPKFKDVDDYVATLSGWQAEAVAQLRDLVREVAPDAEEAIKWSQPVYSHNGPFCYMKAFKKHINFGFWRGAQMSDPSSHLQGTGGKMRHVKIASLDDIQPDVFKAFVRAAVELNQTHGDPTKGS